MRPLSFADKARTDLQRIRRQSLRAWEAERTADYMADLISAIDRIRQRTLPGVARDVIARGYRSLHCGRHVIYFRLTEEQAPITRIVHDRMDHAAHLKDS